MLLPSPAAPLADLPAPAEAPPPLRLLQRWPVPGRRPSAAPVAQAPPWWRLWWLRGRH